MFRVAVLCLTVSAIWALPQKQSKVFPLKFTGPRIINGEKASEGQFPWQAALFIEGRLYSWFCGGSIISEEWILTAGHCVDEAVSGIVDTGTLNPHEGDASDISRFILHEGYNSDTLENDIGLIQLSSPLKLAGNSAAVNLASEELDVNAAITVSGWGLTSDDDFTISDSLNYVDLVTISTSDCDAYYGKGATLKGMMCGNSTSSEVKSTCSGDSGGPVVVDIDSNPLHVGIVSFGSNDGCESGAPSGFTRTAYYRDWIKTNSGI